MNVCIVVAVRLTNKSSAQGKKRKGRIKVNPRLGSAASRRLGRSNLRNASLVCKAFSADWQSADYIFYPHYTELEKISMTPESSHYHHHQYCIVYILGTSLFTTSKSCHRSPSDDFINRWGASPNQPTGCCFADPRPALNLRNHHPDGLVQSFFSPWLLQPRA